MSIDRVFYLETPIDHVPRFDPDWDDEATYGEKSCGRGCGSLRPAYYGQPVEVVLLTRPRETIAPFPLATGVHRDLFELIGPHLIGAVTGTCRFQSGRPIEEYITVYTPLPLSPCIRSDQKQGYRVCPTCGKIMLASSYEGGTNYFLRNELGNHDAWQLGVHGGFIITEQLKDQIDWSRFPDIDFFSYAVFDKPLPGDRYDEFAR